MLFQEMSKEFGTGDDNFDQELILNYFKVSYFKHIFIQKKMIIYSVESNLTLSKHTHVKKSTLACTWPAQQYGVLSQKKMQHKISS